MASDSEASYDFPVPSVPYTPKKGRSKAKKANPSQTSTESQLTIRESIQLCYNLIEEIKSDEVTNLSPSASDNLDIITNNLVNIHKTYNMLKKEYTMQKTMVKEAETKLKEHRIFTDKLIEKIPSTDEITKTIQHIITKEIKTINQNLADEEQLRKEVMALVPTDPSSAPPPKQPLYTQVLTQQTQQNLNNTHLNTICIMATNKSTHPSGDSILKDLKRLGIHCPTTLITKIVTKPKHIEVICRSQDEAKCLLRDLNNEDKIKNIFLAEIKRTPLQKLIVINVPTTTTADNIKESLAIHANINKSDIQILRNTSSRLAEHYSWIVLVPLQAAKILTTSGGLYFGITRCPVRPFTTVLRCRNCQLIGHSTNTCQSVVHCTKCSKTHKDTDCTESPNCVNCILSNRDSQTQYPINHSPTDPNCHTYKEYYNKERTRLNNIFSTETHTSQPSPPPNSSTNQRRQQEPPRPQRTNQQQHQQPSYANSARTANNQATSSQRRNLLETPPQHQHLPHQPTNHCQCHLCTVWSPPPPPWLHHQAQPMHAAFRHFEQGGHFR